MPDQPQPPTTSISGLNVVVAWDLTDARGSPIIEYIIRLRESDSVTYTAQLDDCDGSDSTIVSDR
jgi:hypothetical protein